MMAFLQNAPMYIVPFLLVITVIVTIHELGHFLTARAFGVAVDRFSIGFGPTLFARRDRAGVEWRIGALPIGGYVRFAGDDNAASIPDGDDLETMRAHIVAREGVGAERKYLHFKPLWQRALIVAAGPFANFALSIVLFTLFVGIFGLRMTPAVVQSVAGGTPAAAAGLLKDDRVTAIDGRKIDSFEDIRAYVAPRADVPMTLDFVRAGQTHRIAITPRAVSLPSPAGGNQTIGQLGVGQGHEVTVRVNPIEALGIGVTRTYDTAATTLYYLGRIVTGQVNPNQLGSFVGMARASGEVTKQAISDSETGHISFAVSIFFSLIQLTAFLSVSVGLLNLMPVPVLDGGHLLFYAYESIARRPLSAGIQAASYRVGLALLLGLMLFATWNDLQRLRVFHFLGGLIS